MDLSTCRSPLCYQSMSCLKQQFPYLNNSFTRVLLCPFPDGLCLGQPLIQTPYVPTKTHNHAVIPSSYQPGIEASRHHKTPMIRTRNSGKSAITTTLMQTPSTNLSQSLISARRDLLMQQTTDPRSPRLYGR